MSTKKKNPKRLGGANPPQGEIVLYFPMKVAVARLGGQAAAARALGQAPSAVAAWVAPSLRTRPSPEVLGRLAALSGIALESFVRYYSNLELYKENELFRRRPK